MINGLSSANMNKPFIQPPYSSLKLIWVNALSLFQGILFLAFFSSCKNDMKEINDVVSKSQVQEEKAYDVTVIYSSEAKVQARLFAKEFVRNEVAKPAFIDLKKGLKVEFYDDSLHIQSTLTAKYARIYEQKQNVLIRDSVLIVNKKGEKLRTEELVWNQGIQKFYTDKKVSITTGTQTLYGDAMDFSWYRITNLRGTMSVEKDKVPQ
jgi:LPS export ABC transporter protein LptC